MPKTWGREAGLIILFGLAYVGASFLVRDSYYLLIITLVPIWATLALAWNILGGYAGFVSFGHAAFFGLGAFTVAICEHSLGLTPWISIPGTIVVGAAAGLAIGYPTFRLQGHYFALAMLAYPLALLYLFEWLGFQEISIPMRRADPIAHMQFTDPRAHAAIATGMMVAAMLITLSVERSRLGLALTAIREDERAAEAAGIDTRRWKLVAMALSGGIAAMAGGLYAVVILVITPPSVFGLITSAQPLILTLFGGSGVLWGPVIGALVIVPLAEGLNAELGGLLPGIQGVVLGLAIIVITLAAPGGLYWWARDKFNVKGRPVSLPSPETATAAHQPGDGAGPILHVHGLAKAFGGVDALRDVSFEVVPGEILGIIGPNGAGKTTLFDVINGFTPADAGMVKFRGADIVGMATNRIARSGVGRTFQIARVFPRLSVAENVLAGAWSAEVTRKEALQRTSTALAVVGLGGRDQAETSTLTTKEVRLLEIARALVSRPRLMLLDETLAGLSREDITAVLAVIRGLRSMGLTIVIIEHTMHAMLEVADRLLVLDHGQVLTIGAPHAVLADAAVVEAYLGQKWAARQEHAEA